MKTLVLTESVGTALDESVFELAAAARQLAAGDPIGVARIGRGLDGDAEALAPFFDVVHLADDPWFEMPDAERDGALLRTWVERDGYAAILMPHGNLALDLAPPLATRLGRPLVTDVLGVRAEDGRLHLERAAYGGKLLQHLSVADDAGVLLTVRGGAFAAASPDGAGEVRREARPDGLPSRRRSVRTLEPDPGEVDIAGSEILVGVGRGIEEEENLELVQDLARALGGEVACSRPVVDKGWLPKTRQVGTSGVAVKPRVYVAVGISGSFQHVGGIKGSPFVVAVNSDPNAPIFGFADVGVVGDLFDIVPALTERVEAAKG